MQCEIVRMFGPTRGEPCGHPLEGGTCPLHLDATEDRERRCATILENGGRCWKYATYTSSYCEKHEREMARLSVLPTMRLKRLGRNVVVRDSSVAISDDMEAAIGYVELVRGELILRREANDEVREVCRAHGLAFRAEE